MLDVNPGTIVLRDDDARGPPDYVVPVYRIADQARARWVEVTAVLLACAGAVEGAAAGEAAGQASRGPEWFLPFVVLLMALPLLLVGRFPFAAPVATVLVGVVIALASGGRTISDSLTAFFLLFLVAWLFGRLDIRSAVAGLLLLFGAVVVVDASADEVTVGDIAFPLVLLGLFWAASVFVHSREQHAREVEQRAARAELEQEEATARAVDEERQRIARELHDVIAHSVSQMTVQAGAVRRVLLPEQERERRALESVEATGREALTEMRRLVGLLRDRGEVPDLAPQPSLRALDVLIGTVREAGLLVDLEVQGRERDLPPGVDLSAYRLLQEALTNSLKHAGSARAWVTLRWLDDELELEVADSGRSDGTPTGAGQALAGMRERVALCGGTLETGPRDGGGFVVRCHLPLESAA
jgi:signal transduction histidine kinase